MKKNWNESIKPLIKKYKNKKHPLDYKSTYQLVVMVVLSAQSSDKIINSIAVNLFKAFPDMQSLAKADLEMLLHYINKVRSFRKKGEWLIKIAQQLQTDANIPVTMKELTALPGIGRKSANVIMRESGMKAEGIIVDLHVLRVAPRIGIATGTDAKMVEQEMMIALDKKYWGETGMAISHLGREICRPTNPNHNDCIMKKDCAFYIALNNKKKN